MPELLLLIPRVALLFGGAAAGLISALWKTLEGVATGLGAPPARTKMPAKGRSEVAVQQALVQARLTRLEDLVERHEEKLRNTPSTDEIIAAMNRIFERSATALDERFADQARSIESLKLMVSQTDELLEKVLDSIYSLPNGSRETGISRENASLPQ